MVRGRGGKAPLRELSQILAVGKLGKLPFSLIELQLLPFLDGVRSRNLFRISNLSKALRSVWDIDHNLWHAEAEQLGQGAMLYPCQAEPLFGGLTPPVTAWFAQRILARLCWSCQDIGVESLVPMEEVFVHTHNCSLQCDWVTSILRALDVDSLYHYDRESQKICWVPLCSACRRGTAFSGSNPAAAAAAAPSNPGQAAESTTQSASAEPEGPRWWRDAGASSSKEGVAPLRASLRRREHSWPWADVISERDSAIKYSVYPKYELPKEQVLKKMYFKSASKCPAVGFVHTLVFRRDHVAAFAKERHGSLEGAAGVGQWAKIFRDAAEIRQIRSRIRLLFWVFGHLVTSPYRWDPSDRFTKPLFLRGTAEAEKSQVASLGDSDSEPDSFEDDVRLAQGLAAWFGRPLIGIFSLRTAIHVDAPREVALAPKAELEFLERAKEKVFVERCGSHKLWLAGYLRIRRDGKNYFPESVRYTSLHAWEQLQVEAPHSRAEEEEEHRRIGMCPWCDLAVPYGDDCCRRCHGKRKEYLADLKAAGLALDTWPWDMSEEEEIGFAYCFEAAASLVLSSLLKKAGFSRTFW